VGTSPNAPSDTELSLLSVRVGEALWPVVSREEKFKAKNIVDGAVFRGADFVNAFIYTGLAKVFSVQPVIAAIGVALAGCWAVLSFGLGRMQDKRARDGAKS